MIGIHRATLDHLKDLSRLFDQYRVFYGQPSDHKKSKAFIKDRLKNGDSVIFVATAYGKPVGFVQLYPSFSSVTTEPLHILNDLFVEESHRNKGVATTLLKEVQTHCMFEGSKGLLIETASDNPARRLYEKMGWTEQARTVYYFWSSTES